jgi:hypothetical protein
VQLERSCDGTDILTGWHSRLFVADDGLDFDPMIADVHTDPGGVTPRATRRCCTSRPGARA